MKAFIHYQEMPFPIPVGSLIRIGSAPGCDIRLPAEPFLSRHHCSVTLLDNKLTAVDLRSSHGTIVNGNLLPEGSPATLQDGDTLRLGETELTVQIIE